MQQHKGEFLCEEMQCLVNLKQHTAEEVGGRSKPLYSCNILEPMTAIYCFFQRPIVFFLSNEG